MVFRIGIYRNVWLVTTEKVFVDQWGTFVTTPVVTEASATVDVKTKVTNALQQDQTVSSQDHDHRQERQERGIDGVERRRPEGIRLRFDQNLTVANPKLWSVDSPVLYRAATTVERGSMVSAAATTAFGIRTFSFDSAKGFFLNGKRMKIQGVCDHHDLGCLGAAINTRALQRQLELLKEMGCNGIRTSHNPPAPELLDLCDEMGFIVMDEAFDMWMKEKTKFDYHRDFKEWHKRDLEDMVLRDRNHPSVFIWSIGNEVAEQWDHKDNSGALIAQDLVGIIRGLDTTRPITSNTNDQSPDNPVIRSGVLDLIGYSYGQNDYHLFPVMYPARNGSVPKQLPPSSPAGITICRPTALECGRQAGTSRSPAVTPIIRAPHTTTAACHGERRTKKPGA